MMRQLGMMCVVLTFSLWISACGGCGGESPPPPPSDGQAVGEPCGDTDECEDGLECAQGQCIHRRCSQSVDPIATCMLKLGLGRDEVVCSTDGTCRVKLSEIGDPCETDETCVFGSICESARCVETCVSDASCFEAQTACLPRAEGSTQRFCQNASCDIKPDPDRFCVIDLETAPGGAQCKDKVCERIDRETGSSCDLDGQCTVFDVCEAGICTRGCDGDVDPCPLGQVCAMREFNQPRGVCVEDNSCLTKMDPTSYCRQLLGDPEAICSFQDVCVRDLNRGERFMVKITDNSVACDATAHGLASPGADLTFARLYTSDMGIKGYAQYRRYVADQMNGMETNGYLNVPLTFFGKPGALDEQLCPLPESVPDPMIGKRFTDDSVFSMGCGGTLYLTFFDENRERVMLDDGDLLLVGEYDNSCGEEEMSFDPESYVVSICTCDCDSGCNSKSMCWSCSPVDMMSRTGISSVAVPMESVP